MRYHFLMKITVMLIFISVVFTSFLNHAMGDETLAISEASFGLPQETDSFSTVEVFDSDGDGLDEIFMGGSGFRDGDIRTEGIRAYEYDRIEGRWEPFGSGLPGPGSGVYYGAIALGDVNDDGEYGHFSPETIQMV